MNTWTIIIAYVPRDIAFKKKKNICRKALVECGGTLTDIHFDKIANQSPNHKINIDFVAVSVMF